MWWTTLVLLLLLLFGTRSWNLTQVPPGLTHDEASNGHDSAAILRGVHRIYFPVGYGHEPLYNYSVAVATLFMGQGISTLRLTTVFWGLAQCVLAVALARRWWGRPTALAVLAAYTVSFWALMLSRVGLRAPVLPTLFTAAALAYDHAISAAPRRAWRGYILSGICLGASFYTYMASRGMPLVFPLFCLGVTYVTLRKPAPVAAIRRPSGIPSRVRIPLRALWQGTGVMLLVALAIGAPLFLHLRANPDLEQRIGQLGSALTALGTGDWRPLWANVRDSLPMLFWRGDPYWLYNVAGRPGLEPVLAVTFAIGLGQALVRLRDRRHLFLLLWLAGGLAPAFIAPVAYNLLHAIAALPAVLLLVGRGSIWCLSATRALRLARRPTGRWSLMALAGILFVITGGDTLHAYFVTWSNHRDVRVAYHHHVVALGRYLDAEDEHTPAVITSLYPGEFHDAYTMEVALDREDLNLKWVGGGQALYIPAQSARLLVEPQAQPTAELWNIIQADLALGPELAFRTQDLVPAIRTYHWEAPATWARVTSILTTTLTFQAGDPPPQALLAGDAVHRTWNSVPHPRFGDTVALEGYVIDPVASDSQHLEPGRTLALLTAWQVLAPTGRDYVIFVHLLDAEGNLVSQDDRLDAPSWQWQPGDRFVQLHHLTVPDDLQPGLYALGLGLYSREDLVRLPLDMDGSTSAGVATRVLLPLRGLAP